jgi:hypothetical protein
MAYNYILRIPRCPSYIAELKKIYIASYSLSVLKYETVEKTRIIENMRMIRK